MIPTKTYPLSAIMGKELTDKERIAELQNAFEDAVTRAEKAENRIAELADAFNRVCAENVDFVAESIRDEARIVELEAEVMGFKHSECPEMSEYCADAIRALAPRTERT